VTAAARREGEKVDVVRAGPLQRALIAGLFQFYIYDFSEFQPAESADFELNAEARYEPYPYLDQYWVDEACTPLLINVGERVVGFALINAFAHSGGVVDHSMAEFFVLRKYRRGGVGAHAVGEVLRRFPGRWEIAIAARNQPALSFWPRVVGGLDCVRDLKTLQMDGPLWRGPILQFMSVGD
jgi:predicted acetyltransferase